MTSKNDRVLRPVPPCCGTEVEYRRRLAALVTEMNDSIVYWVKAAYRANEPEIVESAENVDDGPLAMDALPAAELQRAIRRLTRRWQKNFDDGAEDLARWFATSVSKRSDRVLMAHLKKAGITVKFKLTRAQRDVLRATVQQNVSLIRSIPKQYLTHVEGIVMRGVQSGHDMSRVAKALQKQFGVTKRRAALIARDQSSKATSALVRVRQIELGIKEAIWVHSHAGKVPRPTHVAMNGKKYDVVKGMWDKDEGEWIHPGQLINCRCIARAVVPGFT